MKSLKIIFFIIALTAFTNIFCVRFYVKNDGYRPLNVKITASRDSVGMLTKDLTGTVQPGQEIQLDAGGGWFSYSAAIQGTELANSSFGNEYKFPFNFINNVDKNIRFYLEGDKWNIEVTPTSR